MYKGYYVKNPSKYSLLVTIALATIALAALPYNNTRADSPIRFESPVTQVNLVELFSSEGCSSCPPADAWLGSLRRHPGLWTTFVPIEFHVDYWNKLGWIDRFSKETFTSRQQQYAREWGNGNVYTPGFVLNGLEWRATGNDQSYTKTNSHKVGVLVAKQTAPRKFFVTFKPLNANGAANWKMFGALLGNGLTSKIGSGENSGKTLQHEFVVLSLVSEAMDESTGELSAVLEFKAPQTSQATSYSAAFWVTNDQRQKPIQVVGGDLK